MEIKDEKSYWCYSGSSFVLEFILPGRVINEICHPGPNDADVARNLDSDEVKKAFAKFSDEQIRKTYDELYYENRSPNADRQEMLEYILWDACWNATDDDELREAEV